MRTQLVAQLAADHELVVDVIGGRLGGGRDGDALQPREKASQRVREHAARAVPVVEPR